MMSEDSLDIEDFGFDISENPDGKSKGKSLFADAKKPKWLRNLTQQKGNLPPKSPLRPLIREVVCPHCWYHFAPEDVVWIAESPELRGDFRIGEDGAQRFLPMIFDFYGNAIDAKGAVCRKIACPHCHLQIPQTELEMPNFFISIAGAPASGKSYFLATMTMALRRKFPKYFHMNFMDADPHMNQILQEYEELLFLSENDLSVAKIDKTEEQGVLYDTVIIDGRQVTFPSPFIFSLVPLDTHKFASRSNEVSVNLCLYDNAGESYLPSQDSDKLTLPVTRHLAQSNCIFFLFDPLQDVRFQRICQKVSNDPQITQSTGKKLVRQETVLTEMINRVRVHRNMNVTDKYTNPLFVIVTKADAWAPLLENELTIEEEPVEKVMIKGKDDQPTEVYALREDKVRQMSKGVRNLLLREIPEVIGAVEQFATNVTYIPVSATGSSPVVDTESNTVGFRSKDIKPKWVDVPILYALTQSRKGLIRAISNEKK